MSLAIIIIDDSKSVRRVLRKELKKIYGDRDIIIDEGVNGVEAMEAVRTGKYDLMFLDLTMPIMDGFEVLQHIKEESIEMKVIVLSADIQPEAQKTVKALGAIEFLSKPLDIEYAKKTLKEHNLL
ncbi:MAG: response regulator [Nitrospirae bacterium]|nr:response regulator [Nitrospirota bacterium]